MSDTTVAIYPDAVEDVLRYIPQKERDSYDAEDFAGPDRTFPITSQAQLDAAAHLIGHAADPAAVKAKAIAIAKRKGFSLPDAWKDDKKEDRAMPEPTSLDLYLPISRIDQEKREVTVTATAERLDGHGTVIGFDGSKEAFSNWRGNVREMHDPTKAVGRAIVIDPHPETKEVDVTLRVSKGAEDTWQKVLDGTLTGASIGARNGKWSRRKVGDTEVPFLERYDLVELSLVDNPSCPGCDIKIVRNAQITDVLDDTEEETPATDADIERRSVAISKMNRDKLHGIRNDAMQMCSDNGCDECAGMMASQNGDPDHDGRAIEAAIQRHLQPVLQRMNAVLSGFAARPQQQTQPTQFPDIDGTLTRHLEAMETRYSTELSKVSALLSEVKGKVERIAATPLPGGPVATPVPMDKRLATSTAPGFNPTDDIAAIQRAQALGLFKDQDSQVAAAARLIALQNPGR